MMKKLFASLLCLLMCASLACCGAGKNESADTSTETDSLDLQVLPADKAVERISTLWKSTVTDREVPVSSIWVNALMRDVCVIIPTIGEEARVDRFLKLCGTLQLDDLAYDGGACMNREDGVLYTFRPQGDLYPSELLGLVVTVDDVYLVLKIGDTTYSAKTSCNSKFAEELRNV